MQDSKVYLEDSNLAGVSHSNVVSSDFVVHGPEGVVNINQFRPFAAILGQRLAPPLRDVNVVVLNDLQQPTSLPHDKKE